MHKLILGTLTIATAGIASAQTQPSAATAAPAAAPAVAASGKPKVTCRVEDQMGSRLGAHKTCHTAAEWQAINRYEQDNMDQRLRRPHQEADGG